MSDPTTPPAGWYDDGSGRQRWWDGQQWGPFAEQEASSAVPAAPAASSEGNDAKPKRPWFKNTWIWVGAALVIVFTIVGINAINGNRQLPQSPAPTPKTTALHTTVTVPDLIGQDGATARDALTELGFTVEFDAGDDSVWNAGNWTVDAQSPSAGTEATEGDAITLTVSKPVEEETPDAALSEVNAAQFLALAWEDKMTYGGTVHWIADRITTANEDGTFTFKIGATVTNEYGTEFHATIEGDVGGTNEAPVILDSILYNDAGEIVNYE